MPRKPNEVPTVRFNVSLPGPVADRVRALAEDQQRSGPATITALVTSAVMSDMEDEAAEEARVKASPLYQRLARQNEELVAALTEARRQLAQQRRTTPAELRNTPRWAWPLDCLLADDEWWDAWLPRLYELLGSSHSGREAVDDRGYLDLMTHLFPPIGGLTWRSPGYCEVALAEAPPLAGPIRAHAWEPVVRHLARALAALEATEQADGDPYHAMRVQAEISGPWVGVLRRLLGEPSSDLRNLPLAWAR